MSFIKDFRMGVLSSLSLKVISNNKNDDNDGENPNTCTFY